MRVPFNINEYVWLRLTPEALDYLRQEHHDFWNRVRPNNPMPYRERTPEQDGLYSFQLWHLMELFGPVVGPCNPSMIVNCEMFFEIPTRSAPDGSAIIDL